MSPHRPKGRTIWRVKVPTRYGWVDRSTGTRDKSTARAMERMLEELGPKGKRAWDLLDAVEASTLTLGRLYDFWRVGDLGGLRAQLSDVDLSPFIPQWQAYLVGRCSDGERTRYERQVRHLCDSANQIQRSTVTPERLVRFLSGLPYGPATQRKYYAALKSFLDYCRKVHRLLDRDPLADITPPPAPAPKCEYYEPEEVLRLIQAAPEPWQSLYALMYGTAIEVSVALSLTRRDVDLAAAEIRARGTKTHSRDRMAGIDAWALPWITRLCANKLPDAPLFPHMDRWRATRKHGKAARDAGLRVLKLHAARNHWAVRHIKMGWPMEAVAKQLGHATPAMVVKVYGRFTPTREDRRIWDARATIRATGTESGD